MLVQKRTGGLVKTNFVLGILSFVFVLYATFLTRSGILGEMSVHSFADPGKFVYSLLLIFISIFGMIGIGLLIYRRKFLSERKFDFSIISKESFITVGSLLLLTSAFIIFIGTSFPIILEFIGQPKTLVEISFYDKWNLPIAAMFMLISALTVATKWKNENLGNILKKSVIAVSIAFITTIVLFINGMDEVKFVVLAFSSILSAIVNLLFIIKKIFKDPKRLGSYVSHAGVGLFFLGVIASGGYTQYKTTTLVENEPIELFGYNFTFIAADRVEEDKTDREKYKCNVKIEKDGSFELASPVVYWSDFNNRNAPFFEPGISEHLTKDIYLSPKSLSLVNDMPFVSLKKQEQYNSDSNSNFSFKLIGFDMSRGMNKGGDKNSFQLGAILQFSDHESDYIDTIFTILDLSTGQAEAIWYDVEGRNIRIGFTDFNADQKNMSNSSARFSISENDVEYGEPKKAFTVEISIKPYMNLVWIGTIGIILGFFIAIFKYGEEKT